MITLSMMTTQQQMLAITVLAGLFYVSGQYVASQPQRIQQELTANREISVSGTGEVHARPDIAVISLGMTTGTQQTAQRAMDILSQRFTSIINALEKENIAKEDIKTTNFSMNPVYNYEQGSPRIVGYEASESVDVKIRNLDAIGAVLAKTTTAGVNQAGSVRFEIDDPEQIKLEAQQKAIAQAKKNAEQLADDLGIRLSQVKTFTTVNNVPGPPIYARATFEAQGGDTELPTPAGTQTITATVTITYQIK